ncbi:MAG: GntR family transcriptional regulator [Oscillospiraceae bacterium]
MYMIDIKSRVPIYEQLKNRTLELIMAGILASGDKMPSVRSLAGDLGVNPNTIQKAYQDMEKEGIIYTVAGRGSFVSENQTINESSIRNAIEKLEKSAYEARLYGVTIEKATLIVKQAFERE